MAAPGFAEAIEKARARAPALADYVAERYSLPVVQRLWLNLLRAHTPRELEEEFERAATDPSSRAALDTGEVLDVAAAASLLGTTEKTIRARVARRTIPSRRWGGRVVFLRRELLAFLQGLEGVDVREALANEQARLGRP